MEKKDIKDLLKEIYSKIDKLPLFSDLRPQEKGKYIYLTCPHCNKAEAFISKEGTAIKCNRLKECGERTSIFDYVKIKNNFSTNYQVIEALSKLAGITLEQGAFNEQDFQSAKDKEAILETSLKFMKEKLFSLEGKDTLDYLKNRGYTEEEIKNIDLGFYPPVETIKKHLREKGYELSLVENTQGSIFSPQALGKTHTLVIPHRDYTGRLRGFIVRSLASQEELKKLSLQKYLNNYGLRPSEQFFNINQNIGQKHLMVAEGYLDALILTERGLEGIVAVGKAVPSESQLDQAIKSGVKSFTLILDRDKAGQDATEGALTRISQRGAKAYVCSMPEGYKDPDELVKEKGLQALKDILDKAEAGVKWKAQRLLSKHSLQSKQSLQDKQRDAIIEEALEYEETITDPIDSKDFIDTITKSLEIPLELLAPKVKDYHDKKAREKQKQSYKRVNAEAEKLLQEGNIEALDKLYKETLPSIRAQRVSKAIEPYTLTALNTDIQSAKEGLKTNIKSLDNLATIPNEAITIIAGRPSHGKTTMLLNMFLNMVELYQDKRFYFFSYEETRQQLAIKCLNILGGKELDQYKNIGKLWAYLKNNEINISEVEKAKNKYKMLTESERLFLIEEPYYISDLAETIKYLAEKHDNIGAIFIDYIQKIKVKSKYATRQLEIQKISEEILETAKSAHLPIILGAQLGRPSKQGGESSSHEKALRLDNLREAGDIEQDASLVIGLFNEAMHRAESEGNELNEKEVEITIKVLKNRNGVVNKTTILKFVRPILKIKDKTF